MKMQKAVGRTKALLRRKIYSDPTKEEIFNLIKSIRPRSTDKELIRMGGPYDGGYLVPNDLEGIEACFSPGVGGRIGFELSCAERGMKVFMADASVKEPPAQGARFNFTRKFIGAKNKTDFMTLEHWIRNAPIDQQKDLLLQMDIEGFEYEVIHSIPTPVLKRFRILVIEFHMLTSIGYSYYFQRAQKVFRKLLVNHTCVHIHPNNASPFEILFGLAVPGVAEFTFLRKDRIMEEGEVENLPHFLDERNIPEHEEVFLPKFWYLDN